MQVGSVDLALCFERVLDLRYYIVCLHLPKMNPESPLKLTVLVIANTAQGPGQHETYCTCCYLLKGTVNLRASTTQCGVLHNNFNIYLCHPYTVTGILVTSNWSRYF